MRCCVLLFVLAAVAASNASFVSARSLVRVCNLVPGTTTVSVKVDTNEPTAYLAYRECANATNLELSNRNPGDIVPVQYSLNSSPYVDADDLTLQFIDAYNLVFAVPSPEDATASILHYPRSDVNAAVQDTASRFLFVHYGSGANAVRPFAFTSQTVRAPQKILNYTQTAVIDFSPPTNKQTTISSVNFVLDQANSTSAVDVLANAYIRDTYDLGPFVLQVAALVGKGTVASPYSVFLFGPQTTNSTLTTSLLYCNLFTGDVASGIRVIRDDDSIGAQSSVLTYKQCERVNGITVPAITSPYSTIPVQLTSNLVTVAYPLHPFAAQNILVASATAQTGNTITLFGPVAPEVELARANIPIDKRRILFVNYVTLGAGTQPIAYDANIIRFDGIEDTRIIATAAAYNSASSVLVDANAGYTLGFKKAGSSQSEPSFAASTNSAGGNTAMVFVIGGGTKPIEFLDQTTNISYTADTIAPEFSSTGTVLVLNNTAGSSSTGGNTGNTGQASSTGSNSGASTASQQTSAAAAIATRAILSCVGAIACVTISIALF